MRNILEKKIDCELFKDVAIVFHTRPELIEDLVNIYELKQESKIYTKMCELGYTFDYIGFICVFSKKV